MHMQLSGELHLYKASFLLGLLLKYAGLQEIRFRAYVWNSGFQRTHIQMFGESQFYDAYFSIVISVEISKKQIMSGHSRL